MGWHHLNREWHGLGEHYAGTSGSGDRAWQRKGRFRQVDLRDAPDRGIAARRISGGCDRPGCTPGDVDGACGICQAARHRLPRHVAVHRSTLDSRAAAEAEEAERFIAALRELLRECDILVIDSPGSDTFLSRLGHAWADTLVTPINDSFVDFAMLATVDAETHAVVGPSIYSEMVWEARKRRSARDKGRIDWIVMRNRLGAGDARNKRDVGTTLEVLAKRIGFRTVRGFGERVIFRELYLQGLTLMDVREAGLGIPLGMSHVAARAEVRGLIGAIRKPAPGLTLAPPAA